MQRAKRAKYSRTYASYFQNDDIYARQFKYFYDRKVTKYFNHIWHENSNYFHKDQNLLLFKSDSNLTFLSAMQKG